jgi:hypothetical protein
LLGEFGIGCGDLVCFCGSSMTVSRENSEAQRYNTRQDTTLSDSLSTDFLRGKKQKVSRNQRRRLLMSFDINSGRNFGLLVAITGHWTNFHCCL